MADSYVRVPDDSALTGKKVRSQTRTVGADEVHEHYHIITDETNDTQARVLTTDPAASDGGVVVRNIPSGTQTVSGTVTVNTNVQYTEGDIDTSITGTAIMWELVTATSTLGVVNNTNRLPVVATQSGTYAVTQSGSWTVDTELPAAAALGDTMANPTAPSVGSHILFYDGNLGQWSRARGWDGIQAFQGTGIEGGGTGGAGRPLHVGGFDDQNGLLLTFRTGEEGEQLVNPASYNRQGRSETRQTTTISSASETTIVTATASTFHDLAMLIISNTSQSSTRVDFRDDTAGTIMFSIGLAPKETRVLNFTIPLKQTATNDNWTAQLSAAVTDVRILAQYLSNV